MKYLAIGLFSLFSMLSFAFSQITGLPTLEEGLKLKDEASSKLQQQSIQQFNKFPVSNFVEERYYFIGPNDALSVLNIPSSMNPEILIVSPEGKVIIPRVGLVDLKGLSLAEAKVEIEKAIKKINPNASVSVSLFSPRTVLVKIGGNVRNPGVYSLPGNFRVSDAIVIANQENSEMNSLQFQPGYKSYFENIRNERAKSFAGKGLPSDKFYVSRNITVFNPQFGFKKVDLEKRGFPNSCEFDPYIREGDEIFVPFEPEYFEYVSIAGAVVRPGKFAFHKGDKASDLLKFAIGLKNNADLSNVTLVNDGLNIKLSIDSNLNIIGEDIELKPFASIVVDETPEQISNGIGLVKIYGCVNKPGIYKIEDGKTRILDILKEAGGTTNEANLNLAYILRDFPKIEIWDDPFAQYAKYFKSSNLTMEDSTRFKIDLNYKLNYVACDFVRLLQSNSSNDNVLLRDGDLIVIPAAKKRIYVWGQVKNPGYVDFVEGKNFDYYLDKAGGLLSTAKRNRIRIVRGVQKIWFEPNNLAILDGDEIYVPREPDLPPGFEFQYYSLVATGIATLISLTYLIINLTRRN